jgi:Desulfoferrodoxin, N-terminal domain
MAEAKAGQRFQCGTCGTQVVVIKTDGATPRCCGADMASLPAKPATPANPSAASQ